MEWHIHLPDAPFITYALRYYGLAADMPVEWRHNERDGISNHRRLDCLLNRLFRRRSKETSVKLRVTGLCEGNSPVNYLHKGLVTRKKFPLDYVIMLTPLTIFMMVIKNTYAVCLSIYCLFISMLCGNLCYIIIWIHWPLLLHGLT